MVSGSEARLLDGLHLFFSFKGGGEGERRGDSGGCGGHGGVCALFALAGLIVFGMRLAWLLDGGWRMADGG